MSRGDERAIRREVGLTTRLWYRRGLTNLASSLGLNETLGVLALGSYPPMKSLASVDMDQFGFLMATNERLVFADRKSGDPRVAVPLSAITVIEAKNRAGRAILSVETGDALFEFALHSDWPKRRAMKALAAFENHLRGSLGPAG